MNLDKDHDRNLDEDQDENLDNGSWQGSWRELYHVLPMRDDLSRPLSKSGVDEPQRSEFEWILAWAKAIQDGGRTPCGRMPITGAILI